jgi:hypothetical protein
MQKKRRNGRASTKTSVEDEIAHLRGLDLSGLRARWQSVFQRQAPAHLTRHLLFAVIAYRIQADRLGDLDHETKQVLDRTAAKETGPAMSARLASFDQKRTELTPGTVLVREDRQSQRVMVMADGFAWNGQTYDRFGSPLNEHPCSRQRSERTGHAIVEDDGHGAPRLASRTRNGANDRGVHQCSGRSNEPVGHCLSAQTAKRKKSHIVSRVGNDGT